MITRAAKLLLLAGIALDYTLVVFNNLTDFDSNYQFVRHVPVSYTHLSEAQIAKKGLGEGLRVPSGYSYPTYIIAS